LAALCRRHGIVLIVDEVQTGFGRTGRMFACEHDGVEPDLLVAAKSRAAGLPLAAGIGRAELMDSPVEGGLGGTYAGNPIACAAAHAVLDLFESGDLLRRSEAIGARIEARAREWARSCPLVGDVRRRGAMAGVELVPNSATREHAQQLEELQRTCFPTLADAERFKAAHYLKHIDLFPDGQFVVLDGDRVVGATTTLRLHFDFDHVDHTFADLIQGGWLTSHEPGGDWLYGADVGIDPSYRRRGLEIGRAHV